MSGLAENDSGGYARGRAEDAMTSEVGLAAMGHHPPSRLYHADMMDQIPMLKSMI